MPERYVSRAELARQLRLTERRITDIIRDHDDFPRRVRGRRVTFPEDRCFEWYLRFKQTEAVRRSRGAEPAGLEGAKARKVEAEARLAELELAREEGELIGLDLHEQRLATLCDRLRARLLNLPAKAAPHLVGRRSIMETLPILESAVHEAMQTLVDFADEWETEHAAAQHPDQEEP